MLRIHAHQTAMMKDAYETDFVGRVTSFVRKNFLESYEINRLSAVVREQIAHARSFGLTRETTIVDYVITAWLLGDGFEELFQGASAIFASDMPEIAKAAFLRTMTLDSLAGGQQDDGCA